MKTKHSNIWHKKRESLTLKESQLDEELESVSGNFEKKAINILIITAATSFTIFAISKMVGGSGKSKKVKKEDVQKEPKVAQKAEKPSFSFKHILFEKITVAVIGLILSQIGKMVASQNEEPED